MIFDDDDPTSDEVVPKFEDKNNSHWETLTGLFLGFIETNSVKILRDLLPGAVLDSAPFETSKTVKGPIWVCSMGSKDRSTSAAFDVYCPKDLARSLAAQALHRVEADVTEAVAQDFLKEYVNQVMGGVKRIVYAPTLDKRRVPPTAVSLPEIHVNGDMTALESRLGSEKDHVWVVSLPSDRFIASTCLELDENSWKTCLDQKKTLFFNVEGTIEFL